jgi:dCMP deaminase
MAEVWASNSYAKRKQVGCLIVKDRTIIADGYNGTPKGFDNTCEDAQGDTHWFVIHAEANAITKLAKTNQSGEGATIYTTLSPCKECSKLILQTGITRVVYKVEHSDKDGLELLKQAGVLVEMYDDQLKLNV